MEKSDESTRDLRKKLRRIIDGRDYWKEKHKECQYDKKIMKNKVNVARQSRDEWKQKCKEKENINQQLQEQMVSKVQQLEEQARENQQLNKQLEEEKKKRS